MGFVIHTLVSAVLLFVMSKIVGGIEVRGARPAIIGALVLGFVNWAIWTFLGPLLLPLMVITVGLIAFVVSAIALKLTAAVVRGFRIETFRAALLGALTLALMNLVVRLVTGI
ncbi:MAG: phage holin family protein [Gemmatimonadota bacterium]|nr:phage holin family protein [Gemmatimonadota bacterium]MDE2782155.1 phage holin family protein [Gemmatimonadota bacterium]MDE2865210.1 phage holin family protein [Gemmatimonadota bacterium]MYB07228.1 phage holin family protein [Gemmatimonadota bacterium]MYE17849.1 phage holin family protein [Gemmatimonadota bacterium]